MKTPTFSAFIMSCEGRRKALADTLDSLSAAGWPDEPRVILDDGEGATPLDRIHRTWRRMLGYAATAGTDFVLLLEDDVVFGKHFRRNLEAWPPLRRLLPGHAFYASLYNPGRPSLLVRASENYLIADPLQVWGSQALVLTPRTAAIIDHCWHSAEGHPDTRMPRIAAGFTPIYYHVPSLVEHAPVQTTWGGFAHYSVDFDADWCTPESALPPAAQKSPRRSA